MKLLRLIQNNLPKSAKYEFARKIGRISFILRRSADFHYFDKYLLWLYLKVNDLEKAEKIISDHKNDLNYCRYVLDVERRKSFGKEADIRRLDYKEEDFKNLVKVNQELIQRFPEDISLKQNMAKNYVSGGYQDQARFHFFETLKINSFDFKVFDFLLFFDFFLFNFLIFLFNFFIFFFLFFFLFI